MMKTHFLRLTIGHDGDIENPCDNDGWKVYSFNRRHAPFTEPEKLGLDPHNPNKMKRSLKRKLETGLAFWLSYYEHGNCLWMLKDSGLRSACPDWQWDGCTYAGLLVWEDKTSHLGPKTYEDRAKDAEGFVKTYTAWCNGEAVWFRLETDAGDDVDGCGGYYTMDEAVEAIKEALAGDEYAGWPIVVEGEHADFLTAYWKFDGHEFKDEDELDDMPDPEYNL